MKKIVHPDTLHEDAVNALLETLEASYINKPNTVDSSLENNRTMFNLLLMVVKSPADFTGLYDTDRFFEVNDIDVMESLKNFPTSNIGKALDITGKLDLWDDLDHPAYNLLAALSFYEVTQPYMLKSIINEAYKKYELLHGKCLSSEGIELEEGDIINDGKHTYKILHIYDTTPDTLVLRRTTEEDGSFSFSDTPMHLSFAVIKEFCTVIVKQ